MAADATRLSHAYLVASGSERVRTEAAASLAQAMVCSGEEPRPCGDCRNCRKALAGIHPDIVTIERERDDKGVYKRELPVGKIREMLADAWIRPNEAEKKVYIIRDAQTLNTSAQNAILKLLEEPPGGACFILCADNAAALLPTVRSRCVERLLAGEPETAPDPAASERAARYLHLAAAGDLPELLRLLAVCEKGSAAETQAFLAEIDARLTEALCLRGPELGLDRRQLSRLEALARHAQDCLRSNVSPKHVLGLLSARTIEWK